jgi:hypothetical protein
MHTGAQLNVDCSSAEVILVENPHYTQMEINWKSKSLGILCFRYHIWFIFIYGKIQPQWCAPYLICCVMHDILRIVDEFYSRNSFLFWYCHKSLPLVSIQNHFICDILAATLKMETVCSSEASVPTHHITTWCHDLEDYSMSSRCHENFLWSLHSLIWFSHLQPSSILGITISQVVSFYLVILSKSLIHSSFHQTYSEPSTSQPACDLSLGRR